MLGKLNREKLKRENEKKIEIERNIRVLLRWPNSMPWKGNNLVEKGGNAKAEAGEWKPTLVKNEK